MLNNGNDLVNARFATLDSLRGLAAIVVFLFHCVLNSPFLKDNVLRWGITGVDLFFMISGFVILLTLQRTKHWSTFVINRFTKLYPVYWAIVSFTFILILLNTNDTTNTESIHEYLGNLTMVQRYFNIQNLDEQYWTLEVEVIFYLFMLIVFVCGGLKFIEIIGLIILFLCIIYDIFLENIFPVSKYFILINHFPLFYAGITLYKIKNESSNPFRYIILIACIAGSCMLFNNGGRSMYYLSFKEYLPILLSYFIIFLLAIHNHLIFLNFKPLLFMGRISYSFYLIHQYISSQIIIPNLLKHMGWSFYICVCVAFVVCFLLASFTTKYIEEPCMRFGRKFIKAEAE